MSKRCNGCFYETARIDQHPCNKCRQLTGNEDHKSWCTVMHDLGEKQQEEEHHEADDKYCTNCKYEYTHEDQYPCGWCSMNDPEQAFFYWAPKEEPPEPQGNNTQTNDTVQVGGTHYKQMVIQPIDYIMQNKLGPCEANIIKYVSRHADKNGAEDIRKIKQYCDFILKYTYGEEL